MSTLGGEVCSGQLVMPIEYGGIKDSWQADDQKACTCMGVSNNWSVRHGCIRQVQGGDGCSAATEQRSWHGRLVDI